MHPNNDLRLLTPVDIAAALLLIVFGGLMLGQNSMPSHAATEIHLPVTSNFADELKDMLLHD